MHSKAPFIALENHHTWSQKESLLGLLEMKEKRSPGDFLQNPNIIHRASNGLSIGMNQDIPLKQCLGVLRNRKVGQWVWRCHIDLSSPNQPVLSFLNQFMRKYEALIFSREEYAPKDISDAKTFIRHPCIDPLSEKNISLNPTEVTSILERYGVDPDRPILIQVARFDPLCT